MLATRAVVRGACLRGGRPVVAAGGARWMSDIPPPGGNPSTREHPPPATEEGKNVLDEAQRAIFEMFSGLDKNLSDREIERLATTHSGAGLPEILGEDPRGIIPDTFYENETVDLGIQFIEEVQGFEDRLEPAELKAVEDLLDCYFEHGSPQILKYKNAAACLAVPLVRDNQKCMTFLAKLIQDTFHWSERKALLTLVYYAYESLPLLAHLWRLDLPRQPLVVSPDALHVLVASGVLSDALHDAVCEADADLGARLKDVSDKRRLMALVEAAFASFAEGKKEVAAAEVIKTLETIPQCGEWIARVGEHAGEDGTLDWGAFAKAMVYGD